ncbi:hypothetical protein [Chryseolinea sp. H1M3-3]|uniref:hypothetical protein n=1 Tax=Chryseolinea sp. H1M3-3 TaxID=3034144 RepID=UPI0023EB40AA|nr:hypothetical protein [Chryseolinea sp. H1M3-3]
MNVFKSLIIVQSSYTFITAAWPIVHIQSFMEVTGYKTDVWLVKTVGALLIPVASCLFSFLWIWRDRRPAVILGVLTCLAFISIDFYYALTDVISDIYLVDGFVQIVFLFCWIYILAKHHDRLIQRRSNE